MRIGACVVGLGIVLSAGFAASCGGKPESDAPTPPATVADGGGNDGMTPPDASSSPPPPPLPGPDFYDGKTVPKIELTLDAAALAILSTPGGTTGNPAPDRKNWAHGAVKIGDKTFADVGVRRKGASTFRSLPKKASLKIKFNKFMKGQTFNGLTDLTLNNMVSDRTGVAERLGYELFRRAGLPAGRSNHVTLTLNGEDYGVYSNVETPNEQYLARLFPTIPITTLYEADGGEWDPASESDFEVKVGPADKGDLLRLFTTATAAKTATLLTDVAPRLDTAEWLKYSAAEALIGNLDGYGFGIYGSHNYFLAGSAGAVFSILPWSLDLAFTDEDTVVDANTPLHANAGPPPRGVTAPHALQGERNVLERVQAGDAGAPGGLG